MTDLQNRLQNALADRYALEREIGRGGMATVYLAQDLKHRRPVAIKVLHPHLAEQLGPERFLREINIAARLNHPHILTLIDSGEGGGCLYYVMPFVEGESLRGRLNREKQLPVEDALQIARQVAGALNYAHTSGVVHRDVKPENVMLHQGEPMVTDFGIAKAVSAAGSDSLTLTGMAVGTPAYMSPEQAMGEAELDARSDIYSLGCVLYEMLAGTPPFTGPTPQAVITRRLTTPVPPLRPSRTGVPESVERALAKALGRDPSERYETAAQFAQALSQPGLMTPPGSHPQASARAKSIAVLPFTDMSPERDQEYFTDGIAEEIINALTKVQALRVASRSSAFAFKGKNQDIRQVGEQLNVGTVLEGSVRKAGNRLRITAQLVNVADGYHLWSERYDRDLEDVFAVQDEIAENIVKALRVVLSEDEKRAIEKPRTDNVQAYEYYLRGRQFFHQFREKSLQFARRMFARAIELDPTFVLAHAGMADCSSFLYTYYDASEANLDQANTASLKAMSLGPEMAEAHASRGLALTLSKHFQEAEQELQTAMRLDPTLFEAHYFYGRACFQQGKLAEAAKGFEQATAVRPEDYQSPGLLALAYNGLGRQADADAARRLSLQTVERHIELNPDDARALYWGANSLARVGNREKSLDWVGRALAIDPEDAGVLYNAACVHSILGETNRAIELLEKSIQNGFGHRAWIENDPDLDPLREHPRYQAFLKNV